MIRNESSRCAVVFLSVDTYRIAAIDRRDVAHRAAVSCSHVRFLCVDHAMRLAVVRYTRNRNDFTD